MISNYSITGMTNINNESAQSEMIDSDFIITKRGNKRDAISHIGVEIFENIKIILLDQDNIEELLRCKHESEESIKLTIDISLIDRKSLADIFSLLAKLAIEHTYIVKIIYSVARYAPPSGKYYSNATVKPVSNFFSGWSTRPGMPVLSIVGLGYEKDKAMGAIEYLESSKAFLFIPESIENKYYADVMKENYRILDIFDKSNQFPYKLESSIEAIFSLDSVISANKNNYKVVLLPFGPKLFYALSLLTCIPHPEVSIWYVSGESGDNDSSQDRNISELLGFKFCIKNTE